MEGHARISDEVLGAYAADAALEVEGVRGLVAATGLPRQRAVKVVEDGDAATVELHLALDWGASLPSVGRAVQQRVADYLDTMADVRPGAVEVVAGEVGPPPAG
jgi:uncharacterized alkaline shock family protein YloU